MQMQKCIIKRRSIKLSFYTEIQFGIDRFDANKFRIINSLFSCRNLKKKIVSKNLVGYYNAFKVATQTINRINIC